MIGVQRGVSCWEMERVHVVRRRTICIKLSSLLKVRGW